MFVIHKLEQHGVDQLNFSLQTCIPSLETLFWFSQEKQMGGQLERAQGLLERVMHG